MPEKGMSINTLLHSPECYVFMSVIPATVACGATEGVSAAAGGPRGGISPVAS